MGHYNGWVLTAEHSGKVPGASQKGHASIQTTHLGAQDKHS